MLYGNCFDALMYLYGYVVNMDHLLGRPITDNYEFPPWQEVSQIIKILSHAFPDMSPCSSRAISVKTQTANIFVVR